MSARASDLLPNIERDPEWAKHVQDVAIQRGLPARLATRVYMIRGDEAAGIWLLDGDDMPPVLGADLEVTAGLGLGVMTSRTGPSALEAIYPYLRSGVGLHLLSRSSDIGDVHLLQDARRLEALVTDGRPSQKIDLSRLSRLRRLAIEGEEWVVDWDSPSLRTVLLAGVPVHRIALIGAPLEFLSIEAGRRLTDLRFLADASHLETLFVSGAGVFDCSALSRAANLVHVVFDDCLGVVNAQNLADLRRLRRLTFDNAGIVHPTAPLREMDLEVFEVHRNYSFGPEFANAGHQSVIWQVPSKRAMPAKRRSWVLADQDFTIEESDTGASVFFEESSLARMRVESLGMGGSPDSHELREVFKALVKDGSSSSHKFDSEGERVVMRFAEGNEAQAAIQRIIDGWNDSTRAYSAFTSAKASTSEP